MLVGVPDSVLKKIIKNKKCIFATDEAEAVAIAVGYYLATGKEGEVFAGSNGFLNAMDFLTSLVIPYNIPVKWTIGVGRKEEWHEISSDILIKAFYQDEYFKKRNFKTIRKRD